MICLRCFRSMRRRSGSLPGFLPSGSGQPGSLAGRLGQHSTARSGPEDGGGMSTAYGEPVHVQARDDGRPARFIWRSRLYTVRAILEHWIISRETWRDRALSRASANCDGKPIPMPGPCAGAAAEYRAAEAPDVVGDHARFRTGACRERPGAPLIAGGTGHDRQVAQLRRGDRQRPAGGSPGRQAEIELALPGRRPLPRCGLECLQLRVVMRRAGVLGGPRAAPGGVHDLGRVAPEALFAVRT
jgi:Domain of unknown function (DUF6504)